ncbi:chaplin [Streptomyces sp. NPDC048664]|uniref:chaplin n=1 Tax=Streptomyces sp. NPDC048664 TaxID=3154505 RepID=UPI003418023A
MRQTLSRGMVAAAAATGILSLCGSPVFADSSADGTATGSPGVASGNTIQVPLDLPVNLCGNTINVLGALNPASGNACGNGSDMETPPDTGVAGLPDDPDCPDTPVTPDNPGTPTTPVTPSTPSTPTTPTTPSTPSTPTTPTTPSTPATPTTPVTPAGNPDGSHPVQQASTPDTTPQLAETGSEGLLAASAVSVAMLAGGLVLYRRGRATSQR